MKHLLIIVVMIFVWLNGFIWLGNQIDPSTKHQTEVEYNYKRYCSGCHGYSGEGDGRIGRFKKLAPADLTDSDLWTMHDDAHLLESIRDGKDDMPAFHYYLSDDEQEELLEYIKNMFTP